MNKIDLSAAQWRKSSHSGGQTGQCVEVAQVPGIVGIRDSKNPAGPHLVVSRAALARLVGQIKAGESA